MPEETKTELPAEFLEKRKKARRRRIIRIIVIVAIIVIIIVALLLIFFGRGRQMPDMVDGTGTYTQPVTVGTLDLSIEGSGTLDAASTVSDGAKVSGTVKKVFVRVGDTVEKGDKLFTLKSDEVDSAIEEAEANLDSAQSNVDSTRQAYVSARDAYRKAKKQAKKSGKSSSGSSNASGGSTNTSDGFDTPRSSDSGNPVARLSKAQVGTTTSTITTVASTSSESVSQAQSAYQSAKSAWQEAKSARDAAQEAYDEACSQTKNLTVKASASGTVSAVGVSVGMSVGASASSSSVSGLTSSASSGTVTISDDSSMMVTMQVSEYDISNVEVGQKATVTVTALEQQVKARVSEVAVTTSESATASSSNVYYDVTLKIPHPTDDMVEGMSVTTELIYQSFPDALLVPTAAIEEGRGDTSTVTVQGEDGSTRQVGVTVLGGNDEQSAVEGDLAAGDLVQVGYQMSSDSEDSFGGMPGGMQRGGGSESSGDQRDQRGADEDRGGGGGSDSSGGMPAGGGMPGAGSGGN